MEPSVEWKLVSVGVDWLTITAQSAADRTALLYLAELESGRNERNGAQRRAWRSNGYDGWSVGTLKYGHRDDSDIVKLSGDVSRETFTALTRPGFRCTRIDVQVTAASSQYWPMYGEAAMLQAEWDRECMKGTSDDENFAKIKRIDGRGDGDTIQVGSRSSVRYGRLYDKQAESGEEKFHHAWRWEVEYKEEMAAAIMSRLATAGDFTQCCAGIVAGQYTAWRFYVPWKYSQGVVLAGPVHVESDAERKLQWIRKQVAPTVKWLLDQGHIDTVDDLWYSSVMQGH